MGTLKSSNMLKLILSLGLVAAANAGAASNNVKDAWQSLVSPIPTKGEAPPCYWQLDEAHCRQSNDKDTCDKDDPEQGYAQAGTCNKKGYFPVCCTFVDKTTGHPVQFWYRKGLSCAYNGWQPCQTALATTSVAVNTTVQPIHGSQNMWPQKKVLGSCTTVGQPCGDDVGVDTCCPHLKCTDVNRRGVICSPDGSGPSPPTPPPTPTPTPQPTCKALGQPCLDYDGVDPCCPNLECSDPFNPEGDDGYKCRSPSATPSPQKCQYLDQPCDDDPYTGRHRPCCPRLECRGYGDFPSTCSEP